jgi:hypothetical protein
MTHGPLDPVVLPNGVARNPGGHRGAPPEQEAHDAIIDLIICLRGAIPNRSLGETDRYMVVGEFGLAMGELDAVLAETLAGESVWVQAAYARADAAFPKDADGYRL